MTRRRPWIRVPREASPTRRDRALVKALYAGTDSLDADELRLLDQPPAKRVQHEAREQERLTQMARREWWWPGYRHIEQARPTSDRERARLAARGVRGGWPDVVLHVPPDECPGDPGCREIAPGRCPCMPVRAALELKAGKNRATPEQSATLELLAACGYQTSVQWGADDAIAWLREVAGPEPAEPVAWPTVGGGPDDAL